MSNQENTPLVDEEGESENIFEGLVEDAGPHNGFSEAELRQLLSNLSEPLVGENDAVHQNDPVPSTVDNGDGPEPPLPGEYEPDPPLQCGFDFDFSAAPGVNVNYLQPTAEEFEDPNRPPGQWILFEPEQEINPGYENLNGYSLPPQQVEWQYSNDPSADGGNYKYPQIPAGNLGIPPTTTCVPGNTLLLPGQQIQHSFPPTYLRPTNPAFSGMHESQALPSSSNGLPNTGHQNGSFFSPNSTFANGSTPGLAPVSPYLGYRSNHPPPANHQNPALQTGEQIKRRSPRKKPVNPPAPGGKFICKEPGCKRGVREKNGLCKRHQDKYNRNFASPPVIRYRPDIDWQKSMDKAYPMYAGLSPLLPDALNRPIRGDHTIPPPEDEDFWEDEWVKRFLAAAATPIDENAPSDFDKEQQRTLNGKARMEDKEPDGRYSEAWINARMRMLYRSVWVFHCGGLAVYPVGGDNGGYGKPDYDISFQDRLRILEESLRTDKLTVIDVIEGRGVVALVQNPEGFKKRKRQNKQSNQKKDRVLDAERKRHKGPTTGNDAEQSEHEVEAQPEQDSIDDFLDLVKGTQTSGASSKKRQREADLPEEDPIRHSTRSKRSKTKGETSSKGPKSGVNPKQPSPPLDFTLGDPSEHQAGPTSKTDDE